MQLTRKTSAAYPNQYAGIGSFASNLEKIGAYFILYL